MTTKQRETRASKNAADNAIKNLESRSAPMTTFVQNNGSPIGLEINMTSRSFIHPSVHSNRSTHSQLSIHSHLSRQSNQQLNSSNSNAIVGNPQPHPNVDDKIEMLTDHVNDKIMAVNGKVDSILEMMNKLMLQNQQQ